MEQPQEANTPEVHRLELPAELAIPDNPFITAKRLLIQTAKARCENDQDAALCVELDKALQQTVKIIEDERKSFVDGILASQRAINERYNGVAGYAKAARSHVQGLLIAYRKKMDAEAKAAAEAEQKRLEEEALKTAQTLQDAGRPEEAAQVLEEGAELAESVAAPVQTGPIRGQLAGTASIGKKWTFEIIDPGSVPRIYCTPDEKLIRAAVQRKEAPLRECMGLRIFEADTFANR